MRTLADFDISINPPFTEPEAGAPTIYPVQVQSEVGGPAASELVLDTEDADFRSELAHVRGIEPDLALRKSFGGRLFDALFRDDVERVWERSLGRIDGSNLYDGLRMRLLVNVASLAALPWELLWGGDDWGFLATAANRAVSRYLPVPEPPALRLEDRLRLLLVVQSPSDLPAIEQEEIDSLRAAIAGLGNLVTTRFLNNSGRNEIIAALQQEHHVVHFLSHGTAGKLALTGDNGEAEMINDEEFAQLFLGRRSLRLVVLNACHSSQVEERGLFTGIGPALVQKRVPAVIAMQYPFVQLSTAGDFSRAFYSALGNGLPVDVAVNAGRQALSAGDLLHVRDWSTPILYMGTRQGQILEIARDDEPAPQEPNPVSLLREAALNSADATAGFNKLAGQFDEIQLRAHRLREWFVLERNLRNLQSIFDSFNNMVKKLARSPLVSEDQIDFIDLLWDQCKVQINELWGVSAQIRHLSRPVNNNGATFRSVDIETWIEGLTTLHDQIQEEVFDEIRGGQEDALPALVGSLRRTSAEFLQSVNQQLSDTRNAMDGEMKELSDMTIRVGSSFVA